MAWTDQCKIAFKTNADALLWKQNGKKGIIKILKKLSNESGIPYKTLYRWWNELEKEKNLKNENYTKKDNKQSIQNVTDENGDTEDIIKLCVNCNEKPVYIDCKTNKPQKKESIYYGLCTTCRSRKQKIKAGGFIIQEQSVCPKCSHMYFIKQKADGRGKSRKGENNEQH